MWLGVPGDSEGDDANEQGLYHSALLSLFSLLTSHTLHDVAPRPSQDLFHELLKVCMSYCIVGNFGGEKFCEFVDFCTIHFCEYVIWERKSFLCKLSLL